MGTPIKRVLVVDDDRAWAELLRANFKRYEEKPDCPFCFRVDSAGSAAECAQLLRAKLLDNITYDAIVSDIQMEEEFSGLEVANLLSTQRPLGRIQGGADIPVLIVLTGYPTRDTYVKAMRYGAWDYIIKEDVGDTPVAQVVVQSAVDRLREIDLQYLLAHEIGEQWLPSNIGELQRKYSGNMVAIWHQPEVEVVGSGVDCLELEKRLEEWRRERPTWQQPFIIRIPSPQPVSASVRPDEFDVFICYNSADKRSVRTIALRLAQQRIRPWFDEFELQPGINFRRKLEEQISAAKSAMVVFGKSGVGPWQEQELELLVDQCIARKLPVIPVLLPSCRISPKIPMGLKNVHWVDFRKKSPDPFQSLLWGITGERVHATGYDNQRR